MYFNSDSRIEFDEAFYDGGVPPLMFKIRATTQTNTYPLDITITEKCGRPTVTVNANPAWTYSAHKLGAVTNYAFGSGLNEDFTNTDTSVCPWTATLVNADDTDAVPTSIYNPSNIAGSLAHI